MIVENVVTGRCDWENGVTGRCDWENLLRIS